MDADGSVVIQFDSDVSDAEKKIARLKTEIQNLKTTISEKEFKHNAINQQLRAMEEQIKKQQEVVASGQYSNAEEHLAEMNKQYESLVAKSDKLAESIEADKLNLEAMQNAGGVLLQQVNKAPGAIEESAEATEKLKDSSDGAQKGFGKLLSRISKLASRVFVFSMITSGLRSLRDWLWNVVSSNNEASAALARLKGALLTMVQPIANVVIPVFTTFVNLLTAVVGKIAAFISALGGKTVKESSAAAKALNNQSKALGGVGSAAKEASKSLASFDEINKLSGETSSGGGGGAGTAEIQPDFDWADGISETLDRIANYVLMIGAGLLLWKIGEMLPGTLGTILSKLGLILVAVGSLLIAWDGLTDAWENGVDWGNMAEMIIGVAGAATALYVAFGNIAAGIALVVGGTALLIVAFRDIMENGFNLQNTLLAIAGIMMAGIGIGIMVGSWIPMLIAAIASALLALTVATGNGESLIFGLKQVCSGFINFITGVFSGDWERAWNGIVDVGRGAVNILISVINSLISLVVSALNLIRFDVPSWVPVVGGKRVGFNIQQIPQIPYLAQGAVIPPNREFMAVLGDQKSGTNIEAPLETIKQAVAEVLAQNGGGDITINFTGDLAQLARILYPEIHRQDRNAARARGW